VNLDSPFFCLILESIHPEKLFTPAREHFQKLETRVLTEKKVKPTVKQPNN